MVFIISFVVVIMSSYSDSEDPYVKNVEKDVFSGFFEACEDDYVEANAPFVFENDKEKKNIHVVTRQELHAKAVCFKSIIVMPIKCIDLPNLERIYIGDNALMQCEKAIFEGNS